MKGFTPPHFLSKPSRIILNITKSGAGFTIPELLISIFIIVLMTAVILPNWHAGETTLALDRAAHKLAQDLRKATELAQRAQNFTCAPERKMFGYGVSLDQNIPLSYVIFAECKADGEDSNDYTYDRDKDGWVETVALETGIEIGSVSPGPAGSIVFIPPTPIIWIEPGDALQIQIVLRKTNDITATKTITATSKGIIDID